MAAKRLTRKQLLNEPDGFFTLTGGFIGWAKDNLKTLIYGVALFFGILVLVAGYRYYNEKRANAASNLLGQNIALFQEAASKQDGKEAFEAAKPGFERLADEFGGQPAGRLASVYLGHLAMAARKPEEAAGYYRKALPLFADDPGVGVVVRYGLAAALQQSGDNKAAIELYEKIVAGSGTAFKDSALFNLGLLYERDGQKEKSLEMFRSVEKEFPDSVFAEMAREKTTG